MDSGNGHSSLSDGDSSSLPTESDTDTEEVEQEEEETLIGVVQMCSTHVKESNKNFCFEQIKRAAKHGAKMVFLPEAFDYIGRSKEETLELAEPIYGPLIKSYQELADSLGVWISLGGFHQKMPYMRPDGKPYISNSHVLIDDSGEITSVYDKIHLFDMLSPVDGVYLRESDTMLAGSEIQCPVSTPIGYVGLGICYDVRFPEFALKLRNLNAGVLTYPSAFTVPTGRAHWESLLRARAIENQCYVIAAAQFGQHNEKRKSYGHSMVVDPWGVVSAEAADGQSLLTVLISASKLNATREKMPVMVHRRASIYEINRDQRLFLPLLENGEEIFRFGQHSVKTSRAFLYSNHSVAMVNKKCYLPGHVLVLSKRPVPRLCDLSPVEVADMFQLVAQVQKVMESVHKATSTTICVQDGADAGRTVEHIHVHVLPRKPLDLPNNDDIYAGLATHDKGEVIWRDDEDMIAEANTLRQHIYENFSNILWELPSINKICTVYIE